MNNNSDTIPGDDPERELTVAQPDDSDLSHVFVVGDTYTILLSGEETAGQMCLIDMHIPPGGGSGLHRHDFEETYTITEEGTRNDVPRRDDNGRSRRDDQHPGKRTAQVLE
jgi:hypothetical protein